MRIPLIRKILMVFIVGGIFSLVSNTASAVIITNGCANVNLSCTLAELSVGGTITIDDKLFDSWVVDDASTVAVDFSQVDVVPLDDQLLNPGLSYITNGQFSVSGLDEIDIFLDFIVSTLDGSLRIKDNSLELTQFTFDNNNVGGLISIAESIFPVSGIDLIGDKIVTADNLFSVFNLTDSATFSPKSEILVSTSILVTGDDVIDLVNLDGFTQRFSQVPEPTTLAIMGIGLFSLVLARRSKSAL